MLGWQYIFVAWQLLCGGFAAFLAAGKRRSPVLWFAIGALLPVVGVALAWFVSPGGRRRAATLESGSSKKHLPKRCVGYYVPDCAGCPYFIKPLFDPTYSADKKGYCTRFERPLMEKEEDAAGEVSR